MYFVHVLKLLSNDSLKKFGYDILGKLLVQKPELYISLLKINAQIKL